MPIGREDDWVQIAELDDQNHIQFTARYLEVMGELGWEAKAFAGHLLGLWYDPFEHMLDYSSGEARCSADQPGVFDRNALDETQDVVEYWAKTWSESDCFHQPSHEAGTGLPLGTGWYRDVLRAKLVSLKIPVRLLLAYKQQLLESTQATEQLIATGAQADPLLEDAEPLSPEELRELRARIIDLEDPIRYMVVSRPLRRWRLFYSAAHDTYCSAIDSGTLFKRKTNAETLARQLRGASERTDPAVVKVTTKKGRVRVVRYLTE